MATEDITYVLFENSEARERKKELLLSEINLLRIRRALSKYKLLRSQELLLKEEAAKIMKGLIRKINLLMRTLPSLKTMPKLLKKEYVEKKKESLESFESLSKISQGNVEEDSIEMELRRIKEKLNSL